MLLRVSQVALSRNYSQAVVVLRRQACYGGLNQSTVRGWYIKRSYTELKPDIMERRARAAEGRNSLGASRHAKGGVLAKHPAVLSAIKEELLHVREAGVAMSSPVAKVLIKTKLEVVKPELLKPDGPLGVGSSWTKLFLVREMSWSYR